MEPLLEKGADVAEKDGSGRTALHLAVSNGRKTAVQLLLIETGADTSAKDSSRRMVLNYMVRGRKLEQARKLEWARDKEHEKRSENRSDRRTAPRQPESNRMLGSQLLRDYDTTQDPWTFKMASRFID